MKQPTHLGKNFLKQIEAEYDHKVTVLIKTIDLAEETKDLDKLVWGQRIASQWISYFESLRESIGKNCDKKSDSTKESLAFIDEQLRFFKTLESEIKAKVYELNIMKNIGQLV